MNIARAYSDTIGRQASPAIPDREVAENEAAHKEAILRWREANVTQEMMRDLAGQEAKLLEACITLISRIDLSAEQRNHQITINIARIESIRKVITTYGGQ